MNAAEQLENDHLLVIQSVDNLPELEWDMPNACGTWSVKDIIAHLTSYEHLIVDILRTFFEESPETPYISRYREQYAQFNEIEVEQRRYNTAQQVIDEFETTQAEVASLLARIPPETFSQKGAIPALGKERSLNDFISGQSVHIRSHCDQIAAFRKEAKS